VFGQIDELNPALRIAEKGDAAGHCVQDTGDAFHAQISGVPLELSDEAHQLFGCVGVELVDQEDIAIPRVGGDRLLNVGGEVCFSAGGTKGREDRFTGGDLEIGDQTERPVPDVRELAAFDFAGTHGESGGGTLQRLDSGHLIGAQDVDAQRFQGGSGSIHGTDGRDLVGERLGVRWRGGQPIAAQMRLEMDLVLKNDPPTVGRCWRQSRG